MSSGSSSRTTLANWMRRLADQIDRREKDLPENLQLRAALDALQLRAWSCATTLRIARISGNRETAFNTASGVLIEFPNKAVVATAWHVLEEYQRSRERGEVVALICDNLVIDPVKTVYRDLRNDLAVIELPRTTTGISAVPYRPGILWPAPRVRLNDSVLLCGFPKLLRRDREEILHGDFNLLLEVA